MSVDMEDLLAELDKGEPAPLYLLVGEEFLVRKGADELVKKILPDASVGLNLSVMDGASPREVAQELARKISAGEKDPEKTVTLLLRWIEDNIEREAVDSFSATDVLRERRAECQGHAYLLAALARALGIPARVVNGIVYSEAHGGFLYHTWNELWIDGRGWRPVDATFAQPLADATHLKLIEGESPADLMPLVGLIGTVRVGSLAALAHW